MSTRALMMLGTASHVGKSILTTALCRILADAGFRVAPFKAQNMSLNSAATPDGREIGRAQALQAEACRIPASAQMNPILLKPSSDSSSQVVVLGRVWGQLSASDYHQRRVEDLFPTVLEAYHQLASEFDIVVLEGAGSPAEINLKQHDIVNLRMAKAAEAACLLIADIDRGGVFASLLGTMELLDEDEREMIRGFVINKFRGDRNLLEPGIETIAGRIRIPCAGVVPYLAKLGLEEEDSVALEDRRRPWDLGEGSAARRLRIGVIAFPYLSNFTDFDALAAEPSVALAYLDRPENVRHADLLILPGSKQTLDDLAWLRGSGFAPEIENFAGRAGILGICGGMQMLGSMIVDESGAENRGIGRRAQGLGLLPIATKLQADKITRAVRGRTVSGTCFHGYEIHLGETIYAEGAQPFAEIEGRLPDGAVSEDGRVVGTYVHGLFSDDAFRHSFLASARQACALEAAREWVCVTAEREQRIDRLADHVRRSIDMELIWNCLGIKP